MGNKEEAVDAYKISPFRGLSVPKDKINFIRSRWMRSYRYGNDYIKLNHSESYYFAYSTHIDNILRRPHVFVRLALLVDDPDVILGFSVTEGNILHYVYTIKSCRKQGIARNLVPIHIAWITHITKIGMKLWSTKLHEANLNLFL